MFHIFEESKDARQEPFADFFTIGSSKQHVLKLAGTPKNVSQLPLIGERWWYAHGYVDFAFGKVTDVHLYISGDWLPFRVDPNSLLSDADQKRDCREPFADYFTIGSGKKHVLAIQGVPKNISESGDIWYYKCGHVEFSFGKVSWIWSYRSGDGLRFRIDPQSLC